MEARPIPNGIAENDLAFVEAGLRRACGDGDDTQLEAARKQIGEGRDALSAAERSHEKERAAQERAAQEQLERLRAEHAVEAERLQSEFVEARSALRAEAEQLHAELQQLQERFGGRRDPNSLLRRNA